MWGRGRQCRQWGTRRPHTTEKLWGTHTSPAGTQTSPAQGRCCLVTVLQPQGRPYASVPGPSTATQLHEGYNQQGCCPQDPKDMAMKDFTHPELSGRQCLSCCRLALWWLSLQATRITLQHLRRDKEEAHKAPVRTPLLNSISPYALPAELGRQVGQSYRSHAWRQREGRTEDALHNSTKTHTCEITVEASKLPVQELLILSAY